MSLTSMNPHAPRTFPLSTQHAKAHRALRMTGTASSRAVRSRRRCFQPGDMSQDSMRAPRPSPSAGNATHVSTFARDAYLPSDSKDLRHRPRISQIARALAIWLGFWIFVGLLFLGQDVARRLFF